MVKFSTITPSRGSLYNKGRERHGALNLGTNDVQPLQRSSMLTRLGTVCNACMHACILVAKLEGGEKKVKRLKYQKKERRKKPLNPPMSPVDCTQELIWGQLHATPFYIEGASGQAAYTEKIKTKYHSVADIIFPSKAILDTSRTS